MELQNPEKRLESGEAKMHKMDDAEYASCIRTQQQQKQSLWQASTHAVEGRASSGWTELASIGKFHRELDEQILGRKMLIHNVEAAVSIKWPGCNLKAAAFRLSMTGLFEASCFNPNVWSRRTGQRCAAPTRQRAIQGPSIYFHRQSLS